MPILCSLDIFQLFGLQFSSFLVSFDKLYIHTFEQLHTLQSLWSFFALYNFLTYIINPKYCFEHLNLT